MRFWTDERVAELRQLAPRLSAGQIAAQFGCTRNTIIGKAARMGISLEKRTVAPEAEADFVMPPPPEKEPTIFVPAPRVLVVEEPAPVPPDAAAPPPERAVAKTRMTPKEYRQLAAGPVGGCLWPVGDPLAPGFRYCDEPRADFRYCAEHNKLSSAPPAVKNRSAEKVAANARVMAARAKVFSPFK